MHLSTSIIRIQFQRKCLWKRVLPIVLLISVLVIRITTVYNSHHHQQIVEVRNKTEPNKFSYPLNLPNFQEIIAKFRQKETIPVQPINTLYLTTRYYQLALNGCDGKQFYVIIIVKSAPSNFERRAAVRMTWGSSARRSKVPIKIVFTLGKIDISSKDHPNVVQPLNVSDVTTEIEKYNDMIIGDFVDSYGNTTLKTMLGIRWLNEYCSNYRFAFLVDDDTYVSVKNLLRFLRHLPVTKNPALELQGNSSSGIQLFQDSKIYAGQSFNRPGPHRKPSSKWYISNSEYPYESYPTFLSAAALVISKSVAQDFYFAAAFTKFIRFDDVFLGILALRMDIRPLHSHLFEMSQRLSQKYAKRRLSNSSTYSYLVAAHRYSPDKLKEIWFAQKKRGFA